MTERHDDGGPAFPVLSDFAPNGQLIAGGCYGMTLLDYFAGQALAGIFAADGALDLKVSEIAADCYGLAAAMLAERRRREAGGEVEK